MRNMIRPLSLVTILALVVIAACTNCSAISRCKEPAHRNEPTCAIIHDVVDCTSDSAKQLITEFGGFVAEAIRAATSPDGVVDWSKLEPMLVNAGIADGMCVAADVIAQLTKKSGASGSPGRPTTESLTVGFDQLRARISPGVTFKTPHGDL